MLFSEWMDLEGMTRGSAKQYMTHVSFLLECLGYPKPNYAQMPKLKRIRKQIRGLIIASSKKKQPIDYPLVKRIIDVKNHEKADSNIFCATLCVGVAGFFRLGELLVTNKRDVNPDRLLRVGHVNFYPNRVDPQHMSLFLPYSKTDKYGHGITIVIPVHDNPMYCPVHRMIVVTEGRPITDPLFVWPNGTLMTKNSFITELRRHLRALDIDWKQYSGHSLRRGAAVSAKNAGVSDQLIKILGRWESDAYKVYLHHVPAHVQELNDVLTLMRTAQTG